MLNGVQAARLKPARSHDEEFGECSARTDVPGAGGRPERPVASIEFSEVKFD